MTKMKKIFIHEAGNTLGSYTQFVKKLTKRGAKKVETVEKSDVSIVFCPIVSRFETDITSAISSAKAKECEKMILVAMHHTFDTDHTVPSHREQSYSDVILLVDCLFFETKGLLSCPRNKQAVKKVCKELGLKNIDGMLGKLKKKSKGIKKKGNNE